MPAYNFQKRFAPLVESGAKRQTIRQTAKGATAYHYTGQRTAQCRKIGEGTITDVLPIEIGRHACREPYASITERDGKRTHMAHEHFDALARDDGFANGEEMAEWFAAQYGLPFTGYLHQWVPSNVKLCDERSESEPTGPVGPHSQREMIMTTKRAEMGMEYWANLAEGRDEPGQAGELRRAGKALDLLAELVGYLRENYDAQVLDGTTTDMLDEADALLAT